MNDEDLKRLKYVKEHTDKIFKVSENSTKKDMWEEIRNIRRRYEDLYEKNDKLHDMYSVLEQKVSIANDTKQQQRIKDLEEKIATLIDERTQKFLVKFKNKELKQKHNDVLKVNDTLKAENEELNQKISVLIANDTKEKQNNVSKTNDTEEIETLKARIMELEEGRGGRQRNTDTTDQDVINLHLGGLSIRKIRDKTKLSTATIQKVLKSRKEVETDCSKSI